MKMARIKQILSHDCGWGAFAMSVTLASWLVRAIVWTADTQAAVVFRLSCSLELYAIRIHFIEFRLCS